MYRSHILFIVMSEIIWNLLDTIVRSRFTSDKFNIDKYILKLDSKDAISVIDWFEDIIFIDHNWSCNYTCKHKWCTNESIIINWMHSMLEYPDKSILLAQSMNEKLVQHLTKNFDHNYDKDIVMKNYNDWPNWKKDLIDKAIKDNELTFKNT